MKFTSAFILFVALLLAVAAQLVDEDEVTDTVGEVRSYRPRPRPCPCKCFVGRKIKKAVKQCRKRRFAHRCAVLPCKRGYYNGKYCCDKPGVTESPTASPTSSPTPTPSKSPLPRCPCVCKYTKDAEHDCAHKPHCKVVGCGYGRSKCCDH